MFVNDYGYDSCKSDVMLFVMVIELPRPPNKLGHLGSKQRYGYRVLQTIQMKLILLWVWAERAALGIAKTALKFKYEI